MLNTEEVVSWDYQGSMLTRDGNIIIVNLIVQYRRADPEAFLFSLRDAERTLQDVTASAIREIVGKNDLDYILNEGRLDIANQALELLLELRAAGTVRVSVCQALAVRLPFPLEVQ